VDTSSDRQEIYLTGQDKLFAKLFGFMWILWIKLSPSVHDRLQHLCLLFACNLYSNKYPILDSIPAQNSQQGRGNYCSQYMST